MRFTLFVVSAITLGLSLAAPVGAKEKDKPAAKPEAGAAKSSSEHSEFGKCVWRGTTQQGFAENQAKNWCDQHGFAHARK